MKSTLHNRNSKIGLAGVLALSLGLRLWGLGWGMPAYSPALMPHINYRTSYHLDEDNFLWGLVQMQPAAGDFDVHDYHWGTLQFYLIYGVLEAAVPAGLLPAGWPDAFRAGDLAVLPRLYLLGRLVSVAAGLAATLVVVGLGATLASWAVGLFAGLAYALAPLAVVEAHYLTNDVTMSTLVAGAVLAAVLAVQRGRSRWLLAAGLLLGLATAAKYSAAAAVPALLVAQWALWRQSNDIIRFAQNRVGSGAVGGPILRFAQNDRFTGGPALLAIGPWLAVVAGFLLGEPAAILAPQNVIAGMQSAASENAANFGAGLKAPLGMLHWQLTNLAAFGLTWPLALLAAGGLVLLVVRLLRRHGGDPAPPRRAEYAVLLAAIAGIGASLAFNGVFVLRYTQPLLPLLAAAAGVGWAAIPRAGWRALAGGVALAGAGVITLGQLALMSGPHPANALLAWLNSHVQAGNQVAFGWPEYVLLDHDRYRLLAMDPGKAVLPPGAQPDYIIMDDMQLGPPAPALAQALARDYQPVARFAARPQLGPFTWDEGVTPHDWKYSHPTFVVYARHQAATAPSLGEVRP